jgi:hypothetical protein
VSDEDPLAGHVLLLVPGSKVRVLKGVARQTAFIPAGEYQVVPQPKAEPAVGLVCAVCLRLGEERAQRAAAVAGGISACVRHLAHCESGSLAEAVRLAGEEQAADPVRALLGG